MPAAKSAVPGSLALVVRRNRPADGVQWSAMSDVSQILNAIEAGDVDAAGRLFPLVYDELRRMAAGHMAQESPGQTLEATPLVHQAYLRLVDPPNHHLFPNPLHFF